MTRRRWRGALFPNASSGLSAACPPSPRCEVSTARLSPDNLGPPATSGTSTAALSLGSYGLEAAPRRNHWPSCSARHGADDCFDPRRRPRHASALATTGRCDSRRSAAGSKTPFARGVRDAGSRYRPRGGVRRAATVAAPARRARAGSGRPGAGWVGRDAVPGGASVANASSSRPETGPMRPPSWRS
jgi:hypothetical protein